jgi:hypothetical protein
LRKAFDTGIRRTATSERLDAHSLLFSLRGNHIRRSSVQADVLLLETTLTHVVTVLESDRPLAIMSADWTDRIHQENLERTKRLSLVAGEAGFSFHVIEGSWSASGPRAWFVLVVADVNTASNLLGQCRKWMKEFERDLFLFRNADSRDILQIAADGSRKGAVVGTVRVEPARLTFPNGRSFTFERTFQTAGWLTAMAHSRGANVGVTI